MLAYCIYCPSFCAQRSNLFSRHKCHSFAFISSWFPHSSIAVERGERERTNRATDSNGEVITRMCQNWAKESKGWKELNELKDQLKLATESLSCHSKVMWAYCDFYSNGATMPNDSWLNHSNMISICQALAAHWLNACHSMSMWWSSSSIHWIHVGSFTRTYCM